MAFDLQSLLPQLFGPAIAWAEMQSRQAEQEGQNLSPAGLEIATRAGVKQPERIRIKTVDQLPLPSEPFLRQAAVETGLLGPAMVGLTLGHTIFVVRGHMTPRLLAHECRHVYQYEACGSIADFLPVYLEQIATGGYQNAALEQDARLMKWATLARSRRAMDHSALVCHDRGDRPLLAGVGVEDQKFVIGWNPVELFRIGIALLRAHGALSLAVASNRGDHIMRGQLICAFLQILHHCHLLERKVSEDDLQPDLEPLLRRPFRVESSRIAF